MDPISSSPGVLIGSCPVYGLTHALIFAINVGMTHVAHNLVLSLNLLLPSAGAVVL